MIAHFYLWAYPRNSNMIATRFDICERYCRGKKLHGWIAKIAGLYEKKIKWDETLADPGKSAFVFSVDCTDCRTWEKRAHHHLNQDRKLYSEKFNHAGLKYEIVLSIDKSKCMSVVGPHPASEHDMSLFRIETKDKLIYFRRFGKNAMGIGDSIYKAGSKAEQRDEVGMMCIPSTLDPEILQRWKSRVRARHESFNARIKAFAFLQYTYRGTDWDKHEKAFRAICTIVQYQMDNDSPLFIVD